MFKLDKILSETSDLIIDLDLCQLRLNSQANFLWFILVPRVENIAEIMELEEDERYILIDEISLISRLLKDCFKADKINIAAFGNEVRQLHIHVIARYKNDPAWPKTVWTITDKIAYSTQQKQEIVNLTRDWLQNKYE
jgi:diadenosine tetraphosphate (Ap4A) HIT family hydrolase